MRVWMAVSLLFVPLPLPAQAPAAAEYRAKANYLANFPSFVEWPAEAFPPGNAPFLRPVPTTSGLVPLTMSLGILISQEWGCHSVEKLLREADGALYSAKAAGRDCVRIATPNASTAEADSQTHLPLQARL